MPLDGPEGVKVVRLPLSGVTMLARRGGDTRETLSRLRSCLQTWYRCSNNTNRKLRVQGLILIQAFSSVSVVSEIKRLTEEASQCGVG